MQDGRMYIDGQWVESTSGETFDAINPATGDVIGRLAEGVGWERLGPVAPVIAAGDDEVGS